MFAGVEDLGTELIVGIWSGGYDDCVDGWVGEEGFGGGVVFCGGVIVWRGGGRGGSSLKDCGETKGRGREDKGDMEDFGGETGEKTSDIVVYELCH